MTVRKNKVVFLVRSPVRGNRTKCIDLEKVMRITGWVLWQIKAYPEDQWNPRTGNHVIDDLKYM